MQAYANALKDTANRAHPGKDAAAVRDAVLLTTFLHNLNGELQRGVRRDRPKTFENALAAALHEETLLVLERKESVQSLQLKFEQLTNEVNALKIDGKYDGQQRTEHSPTVERRGYRSNERGGFNHQPGNRNNNGWMDNARRFFNCNFGRRNQ